MSAWGFLAHARTLPTAFRWSFLVAPSFFLCENVFARFLWRERRLFVACLVCVRRNPRLSVSVFWESVMEREVVVVVVALVV